MSESIEKLLSDLEGRIEKLVHCGDCGSSFEDREVKRLIATLRKCIEQRDGTFGTNH